MTPRGPMRLRVGLVMIAIALLAIATTACIDMSENLGAGISALNSTDVALSFEYLVPGDRPQLPSNVPPGTRALLMTDAWVWQSSTLGKGGCTLWPIVARGPDGIEVARHEPGLCDTEVWEVVRAGSSPSQ